MKPSFFAREGVLTAQEFDVARKVGVQHPEQVRILAAPYAPKIDNARLAELAEMAGYPTEADGVTYGYGVYLVGNHASNLNTLAHELTHVAQRERLGGIFQFAEQYCREFAESGYYDAPLEVEARKNAEPFGHSPMTNSEHPSLIPVIHSVLLIAAGAYILTSLLNRGLGKA